MPIIHYLSDNWSVPKIMADDQLTDAQRKILDRITGIRSDATHREELVKEVEGAVNQAFGDYDAKLVAAKEALRKRDAERKARRAEARNQRLDK